MVGTKKLLLGVAVLAFSVVLLAGCGGGGGGGTTQPQAKTTEITKQGTTPQGATVQQKTKMTEPTTKK